MLHTNKKIVVDRKQCGNASLRFIRDSFFKTGVVIALSCSVQISGQSFLHAQTPPASPPAMGSETVHRDNLWDNYRIEREIQQSRTQLPEISISSPQLPIPMLDDKSAEKVFKLNGVIFDQPPKSVSLNELNAIAKSYIDQEKVSVRDLYEMLTKIDALFDARKVVGRAVLPVQDVEGGIIHVQIVESYVERTSIIFKRQPFPILEHRKKDLIPIAPPEGVDFVKGQFKYQAGSVLNIRELEEEILRFNRTFRTQLIAELEPGKESGSTQLKLTAIAPQPVSGGYYSDSSGRETSGKIRHGAFFQLQNLTGLDESFYCSYDETEGTSYLMMYGDVPITSFGTSFEMSYDYGTPQTIFGPYAALNITGTSERYKPGLRQLIYNSKERKSDIFFQTEILESNTFFDGVINYQEKLTGYTLGISDTYRTKKSVRFTSLSLDLGDVGIAGNAAFGNFERNHF
jgi:hemolysin activation/secretion protein